MAHPFAQTILEWFSVHGRDLPWRHTSDAYRIWLSEVILQQTRISQGTEYWYSFIKAFPKVEDLASASEDTVLRLWQGLGYYSRARNLHAAAKQIIAQGGFPQSYGEILKLKGVGPYTAAAIASFAFGENVAVVDGNVFRVLSRYFGIDTPIDTNEGKKLFAHVSEEIIPIGQAANYNQAIMDFGALQCKPVGCQCAECPLMDSCDAFRTGRVHSLPVKSRKPTVVERRIDYIYIRCKGKVALHKRSGKDIWRNLWEPYPVEDGIYPKLSGKLIMLKKDMVHVLTHRRILSSFFLIEVCEEPDLSNDFVWIDEQLLGDYGVSRLVEQLFEQVRVYDNQ